MAVRYLDYPGATAHLNGLGVIISEATMRRLASRDAIEHVKLGKRVLFNVSTLETWVSSHTVEARG